MRFALTAEQRDFRDAVDALLKDSDCIAAHRALGELNLMPQQKIWSGLAEIGLAGLAVPEEFGGSGFLPVEMCAALERIGYHAAPGPYADSLGASVILMDTLPEDAPELLAHLASGEIGDLRLEQAGSDQDADVVGHRSWPCTRHEVTFWIHVNARLTPQTERGFHTATLLTAAQLLGLGRAALDMTVAYAKQRVQFGRPIGEYQAVKHQLADALAGLEFARPLVYAAALDPASARDVSAAKVAASDAAYRAARTALQVHGAIGYTDEYDLSVYFQRIRELHSRWGTPAFHRRRLLAALG